MSLRWLSRVGLVLSLGCVRGEPATNPIENPRLSPEQLLGLKYDDRQAIGFVGRELEPRLVGFPDMVWGSFERGLLLHLSDGVVIDCVRLYAEGYVREDEGDPRPFNQYTGPLPGGIHFGDRVEEVRGLLGRPDWQGAKWDKWFHATWTLHLTYTTPDGELQVVTFMSAQVDPQRQ